MPQDLVFLHNNHFPGCQAVVDKHFEGYWTLQFMTSGGVYVSYDDREHALAGAWFWPAYPGPHVRFGPGAGHSSWDHRYVAFRGPLASRWVAEGLYPLAPQKSPNLRRDRANFDQLLSALRRSDRWGNLRAVNLLERILIDLAEARSESNQSEPWLQRVLHRLQQVHQPAEYEALAAEANMGLSTLRRRFKQATGTSLHTYALQCRIAAARTLLGESAVPIKQLAEDLGYSDVYFFSRQFRELTGVPPAAYRRSRQ